MTILDLDNIVVNSLNAKQLGLSEMTFEVEASIIDKEQLLALAFGEVPDLDEDLMFVYFILNHEGANSNHDIFLKNIMKANYKTAINKPIDLEHKQPIIGVITDSRYVEPEDGGKSYVECVGVIWKYLYPEVADSIKENYAQGKVKMSIEAWFKNPVYLVGDKEYTYKQALSKGICDSNRDIKALTFNNLPVFRRFDNFTYGGAGVVTNPADKDAVIRAVAKDIAKLSMNDDDEKFILTDDNKIALKDGFYEVNYNSFGIYNSEIVLDSRANKDYPLKDIVLKSDSALKESLECDYVISEVLDECVIAKAVNSTVMIHYITEGTLQIMDVSSVEKHYDKTKSSGPACSSCDGGQCDKCPCKGCIKETCKDCKEAPLGNHPEGKGINDNPGGDRQITIGEKKPGCEGCPGGDDMCSVCPCKGCAKTIACGDCPCSACKDGNCEACACKGCSKKDCGNCVDPTKMNAAKTVKTDNPEPADKELTIDNSKDSANMDGAWGSVNKASLQHKIIAAPNKSSLAKEGYLVCENGWEDAPSEHLKYPHHDISDGKLIVYADGCKASLDRLHGQGITSGAPITHLKKHYTELGLPMDNFKTKGKEVKTMADNSVLTLADTPQTLTDVSQRLQDLMDRFANNDADGVDVKEALQDIKDEIGKCMKGIPSDPAVPLADIDNSEVALKSANSEIEKLRASVVEITNRAEIAETALATVKADIDAKEKAETEIALANVRMEELNSVGIVFPDTLKEKTFAKLKSMSDVDYADYKEELSAIKTSVVGSKSHALDVKEIISKASASGLNVEDSIETAHSLKDMWAKN